MPLAGLLDTSPDAVTTRRRGEPVATPSPHSRSGTSSGHSSDRDPVSPAAGGAADAAKSRDVFGSQVHDVAAFKKWHASPDQERLHAEVETGDGWANYLWPGKGIEKLEWNGDASYYPSLNCVRTQESVLSKHHRPIIEIYKEIEKDMPRTCPGAAMDPEVLDACKEVLQNYALRNRAVGYCQGMNYLAALLCRAIESPEKAFWLLAFIVEQVVPDYYSGLHGVVVDLKVIEAMLQFLEPKLWEHLSHLGFNCGVIFTQYLICFFSLGMPPEGTLQLWQSVFRARNPRVALLRITCSFMCLLKADLLHADGVNTVIEVFSKGAASLYNARRVIDVAEATAETVSDQWILETRDDLTNTMLKESQAHVARLELVQRAKVSRKLIDEVRANWTGGLDDAVTREALHVLVDKTGMINPEFDQVFNWETEAVPFREIILTLVLLQEGTAGEKIQTCRDVLQDAESDTSGDAPLPNSKNGGGSNRTFGSLTRSLPTHFSVALAVENNLAPSPRLQSASIILESGHEVDGEEDESDEAVRMANDGPPVEQETENPDSSVEVMAYRNPSGVIVPAGRGDVRKRPEAVPDTDVPVCPYCDKDFKWFRRRHHCRACGNVVCSTCSPNRCVLFELGYTVAVRICVRCEKGRGAFVVSPHGGAVPLATLISAGSVSVESTPASPQLCGPALPSPASSDERAARTGSGNVS
ncbi:GTPase-activating protein GYP2 [Diplonema papillatum]|nr:GTPase-activating protein GYP2 [Diplonema papillatum]